MAVWLIMKYGAFRSAAMAEAKAWTCLVFPDASGQLLMFLVERDDGDL